MDQNNEATAFRETTKQVISLESELHSHEVQCEERWKTTFTRLGKVEDALLRIESRMVAMSGAVVLFLAGLIVTLSMKL